MAVWHIPQWISQRSSMRSNIIIPTLLCHQRSSALIAVRLTQRKKNRKRRPNLLLLVLLTNARSIKNKINEASQHITKLQPQLAIICETWLDDQFDSTLLEIPNYHLGLLYGKISTWWLLLILFTLLTCFKSPCARVPMSAII